MAVSVDDELWTLPDYGICSLVCNGTSVCSGWQQPVTEFCTKACTEQTSHQIIDHSQRGKKISTYSIWRPFGTLYIFQVSCASALLGMMNICCHFLVVLLAMEEKHYSEVWFVVGRAQICFAKYGQVFPAFCCNNITFLLHTRVVNTIHWGGWTLRKL